LANKDTQAMKDLYQLLQILSKSPQQKEEKLVVLDMDNVPNNGTLIRSYMKEHASSSSSSSGEPSNNQMSDFLDQSVVFCDTMVDRITSQRPNSGGMVPQCEPLPAKALVICDEFSVVPSSLAQQQQPGVICRSTRAQLELDLALKLRIANGTHTAIAHALALLRHLQTDVLSKDDAEHPPVFMRYLDALVEEQIMAVYNNNNNNNNDDSIIQAEAKRVWEDWRRRLMHPHFGLSSFFITQNGTAKGGIRWGPTVVDMVQQQQVPQMSLAMAYAILLRWLTPLPSSNIGSGNGIYRGWLENVDDPTTVSTKDDDDDDDLTVVEYADGLRYDLTQGWYEFKCPLPELVTQLQACAASPSQPPDCIQAVRTYLLSDDGGNLSAIADTPAFAELVNAIAVLYARLIAGDGLLALLEELDQGGSLAGRIGFTTPCSALSVVSPSSLITNSSSSSPSLRHVLHYRPSIVPDTSRLLSLPVTRNTMPQKSLASVVVEEVQSVVVVDLHTHLLPPTHGPLCLWGIDELLTYVSD
jgi:hypothetical protein